MGHRQWQGDGRDRGEERGRGRGRRRHSRWQDGDGQVHTGPLPVTLCTRGFLHTQPDTHPCRYIGHYSHMHTHTCIHTIRRVTLVSIPHCRHTHSVIHRQPLPSCPPLPSPSSSTPQLVRLWQVDIYRLRGREPQHEQCVGPLSWGQHRA